MLILEIFGQAAPPRDGKYYKIGGSMAKIDIGATEDPLTGSALPFPDVNYNDTTEIYIGKRTTFKNTKTYLRGNILVDDARITDLNVTDVVTWQNAASWLAGFTLTGVYSVVSFIGHTFVSV